MLVHVQMLSGMLPPIDIAAEATVRDLKLRIQSLDANFAWHRQKLMMSQSEADQIELQNNCTLDSYHILNGTCIVLIVSPSTSMHHHGSFSALEKMESSKCYHNLFNYSYFYHNFTIHCHQFEFHTRLVFEFITNPDNQSVNICGYWKPEHLSVLEELMALRPDFDFMITICKIDSVVPQVLEFCHMHNISAIAFHGCDLSNCLVLSALPWMTSLHTLFMFGHDAEYTILSNILESISSLTNLAIRSTRSKFPAIVSNSSSLSSLRTFSLNYPYVVFGDAEFSELLCVLESMPHLQELSLRENRLGTVRCLDLIVAVTSMTSLQSLNLEDIHFGFEQGETLFSVLQFQSMPMLRSLNLNQNKTLALGSNLLTPLLRATPSLLELHLSCNRIGAQVVELASALEQLPLLLTLNLATNQIGDAGCTVLVPALKAMLSLQSLSFHHNSISAAGAATLLPALRLMTSMRILDLGCNPFGDAGCLALVSAFTSMISLETLNLYSCHFSSAGIAALVPALQSMQSLKSLNFGENRFGIGGCASLAPALQTMTSLQILNLGSADIDNAGLSVLAPVLPCLTSLQTLVLWGNFIEDDGCVELALAMQSMESLQTLTISINQFRESGRAALLNSGVLIDM